MSPAKHICYPNMQSWFSPLPLLFVDNSTKVAIFTIKPAYGIEHTSEKRVLHNNLNTCQKVVWTQHANRKKRNACVPLLLVCEPYPSLFPLPAPHPFVHLALQTAVWRRSPIRWSWCVRAGSSRGCTGEFWNKNISLKLFFCELNVVGMLCWPNTCQKISKKNHGNPSVTGQNTLISFRRPN